MTDDEFRLVQVNKQIQMAENTIAVQRAMLAELKAEEAALCEKLGLRLR